MFMDQNPVMDRCWKQTSSSVLSDKAQSDGSGAFLELDRLGGGTEVTRLPP